MGQHELRVTHQKTRGRVEALLAIQQGAAQKCASPVMLLSRLLGAPGCCLIVKLVARKPLLQQIGSTMCRKWLSEVRQSESAIGPCAATNTNTSAVEIPLMGIAAEIAPALEGRVILPVALEYEEPQGHGVHNYLAEKLVLVKFFLTAKLRAGLSSEPQGHAVSSYLAVKLVFFLTTELWA